MSFEQTISNYTIKFKDEISYLEAKLEKLKLYPDIPFIGFIQNEMYDKSKCEVESIEPESNTSDYTTTIPNGYIGFALGSGSPTDTISVSTGSYGSFVGAGGDFYIGGGDIEDVHITGNLVVDGNIEVVGNANFATGVIPISPTPVVPEFKEEPLKEELPDDPIENRWEILDL